MIGPFLFTKDQAVILTLIFQNHDYEYIAKRRGCTHSAVRSHVSRILKKTGCRNVLQVVALAYKNGGFLY
jgi:DNA-binding CsgD family transcriptional regulator